MVAGGNDYDLQGHIVYNRNMALLAVSYGLPYQCVASLSVVVVQL